MAEQDERNRRGLREGTAISQSAGTVAGGAAGAAIGSVFGPAGTVAGAIAGGVAGNEVVENAQGGDRPARRENGNG